MTNLRYLLAYGLAVVARVLFCSLIVFPNWLFAAQSEGETQKAPIEKTMDSISKGVENFDDKLDGSRKDRLEIKGHALGIYSPIDFILPQKIGFVLGGQPDLDHGIEFEYLSGSVKMPGMLERFGGMDEKRYSLLIRNYFQSNSFNLSYGFNYNDFNLHLGNEMLSRLSSSAIPGVDVIRVATWGVTVGFGNRWILQKKYCFGVDWFAWAQSLKVDKKENIFSDFATNQSDKDDADNAIKVLAYLPRFSLLRFYFGFTF